ncbi:MAG: hypothetical protein ACYCST_12160 [Acidimicrobiales bacterium]
MDRTNGGLLHRNLLAAKRQPIIEGIVMISNKLLLGLAAGAASLALVGVGAGAAFTSTTTVGAQIGTGSVYLTAQVISCATNTCTNPNEAQQSTYTSDGTTTDWGTSSTQPTNGFAMAPLGADYNNGIGSEFTGNIVGTLMNSGSLSLKTLDLTVTDSSANIAMDKATSVSISMSLVGSSSPPTTITPANSTLENLITGGPIPITLGTPLAPTGDYIVTITLSSPSGGYSNTLNGATPTGLTATGNSMAPVFSFTGSDV